MEPVQTNGSNIVYLGPTPDVGDAWVERRRGNVDMDWEPTEEEVQAIRDGALIRLTIYSTVVYPVSLGVSPRHKLSERGIELRAQAKKVLAKISKGIHDIPPGSWGISQQVWEDLQQYEALDANDINTVPLLWTRPLTVYQDVDEDYMEYFELSHSRG